VREPGSRVQLDHQHVGVPVDHQAGESVVLAVDHPVGEFVGGGVRREVRALVEAAWIVDLHHPASMGVGRPTWRIRKRIGEAGS